MQLSDRFLNLVQQQLSSFESEATLERIVVYVAETKGVQAPNLQAVGEWPFGEKGLLPVEADRELRKPSENRRWYPLKEGSMLIGVLRAEQKRSSSSWNDSLDQRLQTLAGVLTHCLILEMEQLRLLQELDTQREKIGVMVHQLRNPLAALRTYAELLLKRIGPESRNRDLVKGLLSEQDQLNQYVSALDQISQRRLYEYQESPEALLLPPLLPEVSGMSIRKLLSPLLERSKATATLQGRDWFGPLSWPYWSEECCHASYGVVAEIVANLLENAFRYSEPNVSIGLSFLEDGLCVWDGGGTIPLEEREIIFNRGIRGTKSVDKTGSGIGLDLASKLAHEIGGSLELICPPIQIDKSLPSFGNAFVLRFSISRMQAKEE
ncbi:HAMP domain-containing sensor histidine kinase [Prochlorococcus sp. MIT 1300]|uniref:sensor histidine kinase n=1 Tax=Prochlorococcus sp. MIT 1300 TaxID=3096218 RepID=UPI002A7595AC|nr:HAMP domain-containing sensor histidine kinase [Prochlorococcus sp. MIT 1300]